MGNNHWTQCLTAKVFLLNGLDTRNIFAEIILTVKTSGFYT